MPILVAPNAPAPTEATDAISYSGAIRAVVDASNAGVRIFCDFSSFLVAGFGYSFPNPFRATVYRQTGDGTIVKVRSGDDVISYGGIFHAYDDEPPFGEVVAYWAIPLLADGTPGPTSGTVAVKTWAPAGGYDIPGVWFKCLDNPDISMPVRVQDWSTGTYPSGGKVADILGGKYPAASFDVRKSYSTSMVVLTSSEVEYQQLLSATELDVVQIVGLSKHRRRSGYYLVGDMTPVRIGHADSTFDSWSIQLTQLDRPSTAGQTLVVPGRTFADRRAAYPFFSDVLATGRTFRQALES